MHPTTQPTLGERTAMWAVPLDIKGWWSTIGFGTSERKAIKARASSPMILRCIAAPRCSFLVPLTGTVMRHAQGRQLVQREYYYHCEVHARTGLCQLIQSCDLYVMFPPNYSLPVL